MRKEIFACLGGERRRTDTHRTMRIYQLPRSCICAASGDRDPVRCRREEVFLSLALFEDALPTLPAREASHVCRKGMWTSPDGHSGFAICVIPREGARHVLVSRKLVNPLSGYTRAIMKLSTAAVQTTPTD